MENYGLSTRSDIIVIKEMIQFVINKFSEGKIIGAKDLIKSKL